MFFQSTRRRTTVAAASLSFATAVAVAAGQVGGGSPPAGAATPGVPSAGDPAAGAYPGVGLMPPGVTSGAGTPGPSPGIDPMHGGDPVALDSLPPELEKLYRGGFITKKEVTELLRIRKEAAGSRAPGGPAGPDEATLRSALGALFDTDQKANEEELRHLEAKVGTLRDQLRRRAERRDELIDFRLKQLLLEAQGLGWPRKAEGSGGGMPGGPSPGIPGSAAAPLMGPPGMGAGAPHLGLPGGEGGMMPGGPPGIGVPGMPPGGDAIPLGGRIPGLGSMPMGSPGGGMPAGEAGPLPDGRPAERANRSQENLRRIARAFRLYHEANGHFTPAIIHENGVSRSWRVELLPFLGESALYLHYRKDLPWDSPENRRVLEQMPAVFRGPRDHATSRHSSYYVLTGEAAVPGGPPQAPGPAVPLFASRMVDVSHSETGPRLADIADSPAETILVVEAKRDVPWTKPEDIPFDPNDMNRLMVDLAGGAPGPGGFQAAFADGSVRFVDGSVTFDQLRGMVTPAGGEVVQVPPQAGSPETFRQFRGENGRLFVMPLTGSARGAVWGGADGVYTDDSAVAAAAVHAGLLKDGERGVVKVTVLPGRESYQGSTRNGVEAASYGAYEGSYRLEPVDRAGGEEEFVAETIRLSHARAEEVAAALRTILGSGEGAPRISADPRTNSVTVWAEETEMAAVKALVEQSDEWGERRGPATPADAGRAEPKSLEPPVAEDAPGEGRTEEVIEFTDGAGVLRREIRRIVPDSSAPRRDGGPVAPLPGAEGGPAGDGPPAHEPAGPDATAATPAPAGAPAIESRPVSGLGERFSRYRPTGELREIFAVLGTSGGQWGVPPGEIGEITLLQSLADHNGPAKQVFQNAGITPGHIQLLFQESLQDRSIGDVYAFLDAAEAKAKEDGLDAIDSGHLLEVLMEKGKDGPVREILARLGLNPEQVRDRVKEVRRQMHPEERNPLQESPRPRGADPEGHGA